MPSSCASRRTRRLVAGTALTVLGLGFAVPAAQASSHREAPLIAGDPRVDNTDVYAFTSPDKSSTVTLLANWVPFEEPNGGPNFYSFEPGAHYDINIDNDGDAKADIVYRWTFKDADTRGNDTFLANNGPVTSLWDPNLLYKQTYTLERIEGGESKLLTGYMAAPSYAGKASMPDYTRLRNQAVKRFGTGLGSATFAGQADDSFFADLRVFDLLYGKNLKETGQDTLAGYNVNSVGLQVPKSDLALKGDATRNPVVGIWSSTSKQTYDLSAGAKTGAYVQVSRLGNPLVNEVVVPTGLKDAFNGLTPDKDATIPAVVARVTDPELPKLIKGIYNIPAPKTPRNDLVEIYLTGIAKSAPTLDSTKAPIQADLNSQVLNKDATAANFQPSEMLRLNMGVPVAKSPNRLGVLAGDFQGFPNGRRLTDDVIDISLQAVEGAAQSGKLVSALATGDKVDKNNRSFGTRFPYLALPNSGSVNTAAGAVPPPVGGSGDNGPGLAPEALRIGVLGLAGMLLSVGVVVGLRRRRPGTVVSPAHPA